MPGGVSPRKIQPIRIVSGGTRYVVIPRLLAVMCRSANAYVVKAIAVGNRPRYTTHHMSDADAARVLSTSSPTNGRQATAPTVQASQVTWTAESRETSGFCT